MIGFSDAYADTDKLNLQDNLVQNYDIASVDDTDDGDNQLILTLFAIPHLVVLKGDFQSVPNPRVANIVTASQSIRAPPYFFS